MGKQALILYLDKWNDNNKHRYLQDHILLKIIEYSCEG